MGHEVELISDGEGVAVIGSSTAVERFMTAAGLAVESGSSGLGNLLGFGSTTAQASAQLASNSGRWVKLTADSAEKLKKFPLTPSDTPGVSHAMLGQRGSIKSWLQIDTGSVAALNNPAMLAGAAGIMAQMAMQQQMAEIVDYLALIDQKVDSVLRAQTNQALARLDGVDLAVREAMSVRDAVGRVSEVTWSKVQNSAQTIHETQGYALRQLSDLADKIETSHRMGDLAEVTNQAESDVQKWLLVLARCFELHDAVAVLELDRVLDGSPDELNRHRLGLKSAREDRVKLIADATSRILMRMDAAASQANSKVLFNPMQSPAVVRSSNQVADDVLDFHQVLAIDSGRESNEARPWKDAASEHLTRARDASADGLQAAKSVGAESLHQARSARDKLATRIADRRNRRREDTDEEA